MKIENDFQNIKNIPKNNVDLLKEIKSKLNLIFKGKREIMYSDIINLIIREGMVGENYNNLILWCNYKIRLGETFVEF
jgi:hypothetical protein